ncbi:MAG: tetratricopeptide repeat protein [Deltaproteobacteria bacterium]
MATNSIVGWIWLGGVLGVIGYAASLGLASGQKAQVEIEKKKHEAEIRQLNEKMRQTIMTARDGNLDAAIKRFKELDEEYPNQPALLMNLSIAHRASGDLESSMDALDRALKIAPEDWDLVAEKATVLLEVKKPDDAIAVAEKIPVRLGRMPERLRADPLWADLPASDRYNALRKKHGVGKVLGETGINTAETIRNQIKSYPADIQKKLEEKHSDIIEP